MNHQAIIRGVCLVVLVCVVDDTVIAQSVRVLKRSERPDQWVVSIARRHRPDGFQLDSVQSSEEAAYQRVAALMAWNSHQLPADPGWKLDSIQLDFERKDEGPSPGAARTRDVGKSNATEPAAEPIKVPPFSKYLADVQDEKKDPVPEIAGRRAKGILGTARIVMDFDGDGTFRIRDLNDMPLNSGTWLHSEGVLTFATEAYLYLGNVGREKAKGIRLANGERLGTAEEEWSLQLETVEPIVGTWHLVSRKEGKAYGDIEETYSTTLIFKLDHTVTVDWVVRSRKAGSNQMESTTDFDHSTANWEIRDGKIYFSNPKVIRNWRGKDNRWSWFDPRHPLHIDNLKTWDRIK